MKRIALVCLALVTVSGVVAAAPTATIDENHDLTDSAAIDRFEQTGTANTSLLAIDAEVTVAEDHDDVGLKGFYADSRWTYLRVDYDESVTRTVRLYFPSEYFAPRVERQLEATGDGPHASLTPVRGNTMTAVTVDMDGQTDVVYRLSTAKGGIWSVRSWGKDTAENATGWQFPSLTGNTGQWQYIPVGSYSTASPARINNTDITLQYEDAAPDSGTQWLPVSKCNDPEEQRVCKLTQENTTVIMSSQDSPRLRYKHGTDPLSSLSSDINDLFRADDRAKGFFDSIFGSGS